jgi:hypothetical protein
MYTTNKGKKMIYKIELHLDDSVDEDEAKHIACNILKHYDSVNDAIVINTENKGE